MRRLGLGGHWPSLDTIAITQTAVVAVLLVTQFLPQPHVSSGVADQGGLVYGVPLADFVVMAVSVPVGFGMLLTGASRSGARLRYGVLAVVTLLLAIQPVTSLISANAGREYPLVLAFSAAQLAILAVWWRCGPPGAGLGAAAGLLPAGGRASGWCSRPTAGPRPGPKSCCRAWPPSF